MILFKQYLYKIIDGLDATVRILLNIIKNKETSFILKCNSIVIYYRKCDGNLK